VISWDEVEIVVRKKKSLVSFRKMNFPGNQYFSCSSSVVINSYQFFLNTIVIFYYVKPYFSHTQQINEHRQNKYAGIEVSNSNTAQLNNFLLTIRVNKGKIKSEKKKKCF